jgi:hypothetical protein
MHRILRVKAALENRSMNEIVLAALEGYLANFRLEPEMLQGESRREDHQRQGGPEHANGTNRHHG